jgi:signal transduction histidine kinase
VALGWLFFLAQDDLLSRLTRELQITAFLSLAALLLLLGEIASNLDMAIREATLAREAAERANLAKSEFLARMSHDLRTPLNVVIGYSEVITDEVLGGQEAWPRYRDYANDIRNSGQFLLAIVNDILDIARIESGGFALKLEPVDLDAVVAETITRLAPAAARDGVELVDTTMGSTGALMADRRALEQVLQNLVSNAVKFTPAGNRAGVRCARTGDSVVIEVWDEGIGIDAAEIPHLGEPFRRIGRADLADRPGTGLGIAIVKNLVRLHGGALAFESAVGMGTTVRINLPIRAPDAAWE